MIGSLRLALFLSMAATSVASAQPAPASSDDFSGVKKGRTVFVVDESGAEHAGRLLGITPDTLTLAIDGQPHTLALQQVTRILERGDSVKNGVVIGLAAGGALGLAAGVSKTTCGRDNVGIGLITAYLSYSPCTVNERISQGVREGMLLGLVGAGLGAAFDAIIPGRRVLYERPQSAPAAAAASHPSFAQGAGGTFIVVDTTGRETRGSLLRFTPDQLTLMAGATEVSFDRQNVAALYERTNSVRKGLVLGLLSGPAIGLVALVSGDESGYVLPGVVLFSAMGAAAGTAIDALIPERRLVYQKPQPAASGATISIATSLGVSRVGLLTSVSW